MQKLFALVFACAVLGCEAVQPRADRGARLIASEPLAIGESLTIDSKVLAERRRVNVFVPTIYGERIDRPMPVLCVLDGGLGEDFLHIAGLVQILVCNGGMRPHIVVGIENTLRRRDLTGPTTAERDLAAAPVVGKSAAFRSFIADELLPFIASRYGTSGGGAIVGESLAGLFVVETFFLAPELFDTYIAIDPSLWWADRELLRLAPTRLANMQLAGKAVWLSNSDEPELADVATQLATLLAPHARDGFTLHHVPLPAEQHSTIYHPSALLAFRAVCGTR